MSQFKQRVLFLCTNNSARSQMAEAFLRHLGADHFEAFSAGLDPKGINPFAQQAMAEIGIDISQQRSKSVKEYMGRTFFHYIITVCVRAENDCPTPLWAEGGIKIQREFADPVQFEGSDEEKLARFRGVRDEIQTFIKEWLASTPQTDIEPA